ncbi:hypothetical protein ACJJTC_017442 [Scirpophaga incertulas]
MWTKLFVLLSLACVALGRRYPPGVSASVCPDYPVCDAYMLSRFTLDGQPIPEWMNTPSVLPVDPETATNTQLLVGQIWERLDSNITSPNNELVSETKALRDDMSQITELLEVGTAGGNAAINKQIVQELKPVCEMLEAVRSELKTMREDKRTPTSPPPVSLAVELAASSAPQAASKQINKMSLIGHVGSKRGERGRLRNSSEMFRSICTMVRQMGNDFVKATMFWNRFP